MKIEGTTPPPNEFSYFAFKLIIGPQRFSSSKIYALTYFGKNIFFWPEPFTYFYVHLKLKKTEICFVFLSNILKGVIRIKMLNATPFAKMFFLWEPQGEKSSRKI